MATMSRPGKGLSQTPVNVAKSYLVLSSVVFWGICGEFWAQVRDPKLGDFMGCSCVVSGTDVQDFATDVGVSALVVIMTQPNTALKPLHCGHSTTCFR